MCRFVLASYFLESSDDTTVASWEYIGVSAAGLGVNLLGTLVFAG